MDDEVPVPQSLEPHRKGLVWNQIFQWNHVWKLNWPLFFRQRPAMGKELSGNVHSQNSEAEALKV